MDMTDRDPQYVLREGHRSRLRTRFRKSGLQGFMPHEVLELALTWAIPRRDVKDLAKTLLGRFRSVNGVFSARPEDLRAIPGIGEKTSVFIAFLGALTEYRLGEKVTGSAVIDSPGAVLDYLRLALAWRRDERFMVLFLNARNELIASEVLQVGTVDHAAVYPRSVIERALAHNALALILVHNHPSGHGEPSPQDVALTRRLGAALEAVDLRLHDHLIVTRNGHVSLRERGHVS